MELVDTHQYSTPGIATPPEERRAIELVGETRPVGRKRGRFLIHSDLEALDLHARLPEMLVEGFLEKNSLTMICGTWATGKTALLMATGMAVGLREPLAGHFGAQQGRVLFVGFETSPYQYTKQYRRLLRGLGRTSAGVDMMFCCGADLRDSGTHRDLLDAVGDYDLVLLDGLKACSGADENSNTEMDPIMSKLVGIVELGKTLAFTHHTRKLLADQVPSKNDSRGASAIPARCDMEWRVELKGHAMTLTCQKSRGVVDEETAHDLRMDWDADRITLALDPDAGGLAPVLATAIQAAGVGGVPFRTLLALAVPSCRGAQLGAVEQRVKRAVKTLRAQGKVRHDGQGRPYVWAR
jgi:hypothetical protein